ncbi:MAG: PadR family transcriptional regulator [Kofleriaceae bacterium]|nr:PadR family transcriptional regulator [Kofleriaceae bacterium]
MSSTTRLLVLGVVRIFQPVHGYDVRRELISWHAEEWANVAPGSIYNALKSLARDGLLEVVGTKQVGGRPERTAYKLTLKGEHECNELIRDTLWQVRIPADPLIAAISMMSFIDRSELIKALDARAAMIDGMLAHSQIVIDAIDGVETPEHVREMMRLINARVAAELAWGKAFKQALQAGHYRTLGDKAWMPQLAKKAKKLGAAKERYGAARDTKRAAKIPRKAKPAARKSKR